MILHDSHIHVGQFNEIYNTPSDVLKFLTEVGVGSIAVSSCTICAEDYDKSIQEMTEIVKIGGNRVVPILWTTPCMLTNGGLQKFFGTDIRWRCIKVHGYLNDWDSSQIEMAIDIARNLQVPLLFHTGSREESDAGSYLEHIKKNPDVTFILAHSRPIDQTINVMKQCPNAWSDTAFTPTEDVAQLIQNGFADRVMFGTDYPLHLYFYKYRKLMNPFDIKSRLEYFFKYRDMHKFYKRIVNEIKSTMNDEEWEKVSHLNFERLFK